MVSNNKTIQVNNNCKIYIMVPANVATGGPEALHQLAYVLKNSLKTNVFIYYIPENKNNPVHKYYKNYSIKFCKKIDDDNNNILIIPEYYQFLFYAKKYKKIQKIIWWLSLDNYFGFKFISENNKYKRSIIKLPYNLIRIFNKITNYYFGIFTLQDYLKIIYKYTNLNKCNEIKQAKLHLMQSDYAYNYLKKKLPNSKLLYDYQRDILIKSSKSKIKKKLNIICYSHKSNYFINLIKSYTGFHFIKLSGLNSKEIIDIFRKTKIYMDFGFHPGKDRMPREAMLFNNCVITNMKGSANNNIDIPIKSKFKFTEKYSNLNNIKILINQIFFNHKKELKNFNNYKKKILNEKKVFEKQVLNIFKKNYK